MLDGTDIVYVARVPTRRIMSVRITIGTSFPAYATSMGRVLLAGLPDAAADAAARGIRSASPDRPHAHRRAALRRRARAGARAGLVARGRRARARAALDRGSAARTATGAVVAALNVSTSATRDSVDRVVDVYLPALRSAADAIDAELRLV